MFHLGGGLQVQKEVYKSAANMQVVLRGIKEAFDDHLESINNNTNEIESNHEILNQLICKLDKLTERVDSMALYLHKKDLKFKDTSIIEIAPLTRREKEVFQALYELVQGLPHVSYKQLAKKIGMTISLVQNYITSLIEKGVPIEKRYVSRQAFITLQPKFQRLQAKNNVVGLNAKLSAWM